MIRVGLLAAMEEELLYLKNVLAERGIISTPCDSDSLERYEVEGIELFVSRCGIGKVNAACSAYNVLHYQNSQTSENVPLSLLLNTGVAGGTSLVSRVGDVVIAETLYYHDVDATPFGYEYGQIPQEPLYFPCSEKKEWLLDVAKEVLKPSQNQALLGGVATGDQFCHQEEHIATIEKIFPQTAAIEMEGAAIAQVAHHAEVEFLSIRAISDFPHREENAMTYEKFVDLASENSAKIVLHFLKELGKRESS